MFLAFGLLFPLGAGISRWGRGCVASKGATAPWFLAHRMTNSVGWVVLLVGLVCIVASIPSQAAHFSSNHARLGLALAIFGLAQPFVACVRPHAPAPDEIKGTQRRVWEAVHKGVGWGAIAFGAPAAIITGLGQLPAPTWLVAYYVFLAFSIALCVLLTSGYAGCAKQRAAAPLRSDPEPAAPQIDKVAPNSLSWRATHNPATGGAATRVVVAHSWRG